MNEMTLSGLLRSGNTDWATYGADFMVIWVEGATPQPELIINYPENFAAKLGYYEKAYNEDLTLKANPTIKIVNYGFMTKSDLFEIL